MNCKILYNSSGFSLIDLLIAILILSIGLLAVGKMQISSLASINNSNQRLEAACIAQSKMDMLLSLAYNSTLLSTEHNDTFTDDKGTKFLIISNPKPGPVANTKIIEVDVKWPLPNPKHSFCIKDIKYQ